MITGVTGQVARPLAISLARDNDVVGAARFTDGTARQELEAAGVPSFTLARLLSDDERGVGDPAELARGWLARAWLACRRRHRGVQLGLDLVFHRVRQLDAAWPEELDPVI